MSMSGTDLSTKPAASCSRARTSRVRSGACAPTTACISPGLARASWRTTSSARSRGCSLPAPRRLSYRPSRQRPTPTRCRDSRRRVRWPDRSCRWWHPRSAPINCSAARARARPRSMRSPHGRWSRASRSRRLPAAPMISLGRAAKSDANKPRAKRHRHRFRPTEPQRHPARRRSRKSLVRSNPVHLHRGTFLEMCCDRHRPMFRGRLAMSDRRRGHRVFSGANR